MKKIIFLLALTAIFNACTKETDTKEMHYYEVGMKNPTADWRDSSFVVATNNVQLINEIEAQLKIPVNQRKMVNGALVAGSGGYNKNATHEFKWHFKENDWKFAEMSIEIYDGRPYSDVDTDTAYWLNTMKRFSPWNSYIKREINLQP